MVATVSSATATSGTSGTAYSAKTAQSQFLNLLVTQMQNQDPLNPMDNSQVTSQMAQLNMVQGISNLNTTMGSLSSAFTSNQVLQAASLIGKSVLSAGNGMTLANGAANFGVDLPQAVDNLTVTVKDAAGNVMQTMDLGPQAAGSLPLTWDGKTSSGAAAPNGNYTFSVSATQGGNQVTANALACATVTAVSQDATGVLLNLGNSTSVGLSSVKQIL